MPETDEVQNSDELATAAAKMPGNRRIEVVELSSSRIEVVVATNERYKAKYS